MALKNRYGWRTKKAVAGTELRTFWLWGCISLFCSRTNELTVNVPDRPQNCLWVDFFIPRSSFLFTSATPWSFSLLKNKDRQKVDPYLEVDEMQHLTLKEQTVILERSTHPGKQAEMVVVTARTRATPSWRRRRLLSWTTIGTKETVESNQWLIQFTFQKTKQSTQVSRSFMVGQWNPNQIKTQQTCTLLEQSNRVTLSGHQVSQKRSFQYADLFLT